MQQDQRDDFNSAERRKRTVWIVIAHLLVVGAFFAATFFWGNFE
jgi:flagellar basal body-associated protein FliL